MVAMEPIINQIHKLLLKNKKTIAIAESCTGGLLSNLLTQLSGSSQYFILGVVAYHNRAKQAILKIPASIITQKGAVSKEIAYGMAKNIRKIAKTDLGIGVTGLAGPSGGTANKPVGSVFIALDSRKKKISKKFIFKGSRISIRKNAVQKALELLRRTL